MYDGAKPRAETGEVASGVHRTHTQTHDVPHSGLVLTLDEERNTCTAYEDERPVSRGAILSHTQREWHVQTIAHGACVRPGDNRRYLLRGTLHTHANILGTQSSYRPSEESKELLLTFLLRRLAVLEELLHPRLIPDDARCR